MTGVTLQSRGSDHRRVAMEGKAMGGGGGERRGRPKKNGAPPAREEAAREGPSRSPDSAVAVRKHHHKHSVKHRYEVLETLGKGTYGKVNRATEKGTGRMVAVKSIRKDKITDELDRVHLQREIEITALLKHDHIVQIYEVFENKDKIIIVMEYASNGELYDYVNDRQRITENEARNFFRQIVSAVHYCHKNRVVHRDLKLENILLDENLNVKLADFGLSNMFQKDQVLETYCGSPLYAAPEIINGFPYQGPEVDCWALGVLLYALVYGSMPFDNSSYKTLSEQISSGEYRKPPHLSGACGLIDWMLTVNIKGRATIEDIANHWWVNWGYDSTVCECNSAQECHSPLLARYIDWQNTSSFEENGCHREQEKISCLQPRETKNSEVCLRKSKKENDIKHSHHDTSSKVTSKKPKGILKKRSSFDSAFFSASFSESLNQICDPVGQELCAPAVEHASTFGKAEISLELTLKMPKKGILKKPYMRESGYSSSPERGIFSDCPSIKDNSTWENMERSKEKIQRRKGILKRHGRFATSLDLPVDCSVLKLSDSLNDLILCGGQTADSPSRPSSVISDDSFLSCDSFDLLDMTALTRRQLFACAAQGVVYSSASEEEDPGSILDTSQFSDSGRELESHGFPSRSAFVDEFSDSTSIYNQAKNICDCLKEKENSKTECES
ncbi:NUAK family SNF1-like kinase 1 [Rhinatrema bivittatum]|uniref:NUAK family SNF1-like kinase 1 n=1 Tax=Rhinatrema bivittatum TaxID=194408 RepID=UPI0011292700|nr:NUAK family SNF1-like kinase 1 [Rhinatrema bivittatum]